MKSSALKAYSYKDLEVWKTAIDIADLTYEITNDFPIEERWALAGKMQQAAISVCGKIAEGFARKNPKQYQELCCQALGACSELEAELVLADRRDFVSQGILFKVSELIEEEKGMLSNLIENLSEPY
jgi:four helix bundle protein